MDEARFDQALNEIEDSVESGDGARTLDALLAAWRVRRLPLLTDAIEALSARFATVIPPIEGKTERVRYEKFLDLVAKRRSVDVARIVAELPHASLIRAKDHVERLAVMEPDPRVARALLDHVATHRYNLFHPIWTGIFRELRRHGDERICQALEGLLPPDDVSGANNLRSRIQYALDHIPRSLPQSDEQRRRLESIVAAIDSLNLELPADAPPKERGDEAALFEQMIDRPEDDEVRLVLADIYAERGEVRAELIQLQIANTRADKPLVKNVKREQQILKKHLVELLGPIEPLVDKGTVRFSRGFLAHAELKTKTAAQRELLSHPLLRTLQSVSTREVSVVRGVRVQSVSGLPWKAFVELAHGRLPVPHLRRVELRVSNDDRDKARLERLDGLPGLEVARFNQFGFAYDHTGWSFLLDGPLAALGIELELDFHQAHLPKLLAQLDARPRVRRLGLHPRTTWESTEDLRVDVERSATGYRLTLQGANYRSVLLNAIFSGLQRSDVTFEVHGPPAEVRTWLEPRLDDRWVVT